MEIISREIYIKRIRPFIKQNLVKVLVGQRRVGKSYILKLLQAEVRKQFPDANIIFIDKEQYTFDKIKTYTDLIEVVENTCQNTYNFLFIDEVQEIENFEKAIRHFLNKGTIDVYITGSNAQMLSSDIATLLSGRSIVFQIHPLSYTEYLTFHKQQHSNQSLNNYLIYGGLPYMMHLPNDTQVYADYLKNIYSGILFRDVVVRNSLRDTDFLENLTRFLATNTGSLTTAKSISDYLKAQKTNKSVPIIINYLNYLEQSYFIKRIKRREINGKKIFEIGEKIYFEDLGIRNALTGFMPNEIHKNMENVVINHLEIMGYEVWVGNNGAKEIDFIAMKNNEKKYFQVTYLLQDENTIKREFGNLLEIKDNYPKYVISLDEWQSSTSYQGIIHLHLSDFLLNFE